MVIAQAKLTRKHQITIPTEARRRLGLEAGDIVTLAFEGGQLVLRGLTSGWTEAYWGLGAEMWSREGGGETFLEAERKSWDE